MLHAIYGINLVVEAAGQVLYESKNDQECVLSKTTHGSFQFMTSLPNSNSHSIFHGLFNRQGKIDEQRFSQVQRRLRNSHLCDLAETRDLDHYNLFEKAVIYNSPNLMRYLISLIPDTYKAQFVSIYLQEPFHMACLLGCKDIVKMLIERFPLFCKVKGRVRIRTPIGPPNHELKPLVAFESTNEPFPKHCILRWVQNHHDELAVYFATCTNQLEVVQLLMDHLLTEEACSLDTIKELLAVACSCGALDCIKYLSALLPEGINTRDVRGCAILQRGLSHGVKYIDTLVECGLTNAILNDLDGQGGLNALHVFYSNLSHKDRVYFKYKEVFEVTKLLIELGVDVNQESSSYTTHGRKETMLGLLLDRLNLIVDTDSKVTHIPVRTRLGLQKAFDEDVNRSVALILSSGFDLKSFGSSVLLNLYSNHKHFLRFNIANMHPQLENGAYGLENILTVASMLFKQGIPITYGRREKTPLLAFLSGFLMPVSPFDALGDRIFGDAYKRCLQILLENGIDPNTYPLSRRTQHLPPLIRLVDLFTTQWTDHATADTLLDATCLQKLCDMISLLADAGASFTCTINPGGYECVTRGVFDNLFCAVVHNPPLRNPMYISRSVELVETLTTLLINKGAIPRLCEYAAYMFSGLGIMDSKAKLSLLYHWIYAGVLLNDPETDNILGNPRYHALLQTLHNLAGHKVFYCVFNEGLKRILEMQENNVEVAHPTTQAFTDSLTEMGSSVRHLKHLCRIAINQNVCSSNKIDTSPLPSELRRYVTDFGMS